MDRPKRAPAYFLLDHVLIDAMFRTAIIMTSNILGPGIERFLVYQSAMVQSREEEADHTLT